MDVTKGKPKKGLIMKSWERCKLIGGGNGGGGSGGRSCGLMTKSQSWPSCRDEKPKRKGRVAPEGCFSVYVGPQKQRFVIKTEYANHPLFQVLLEEAELEYGYNCEGPLALPCNVDIFYKVLVEMDSDSEEIKQGCAFAKGHGSYRLLCPSPLVAMNKFY